MKILIDLGHPAHIHYFRNFIKIMEGKGHQFELVARDKEVLHKLLNQYNLPFKTRGKGSKGLIGKLLYLFYADYIVYRIAKKFKPDLFLSFASPYAAQVSKLMGKPHIAFDDTEHAKIAHLLYQPFTDSILTPEYFKKDFGPKHIRFSGIMDLAYLHPKHFTPDKSVVSGLKQDSKKPIVLLRFVGWHASHDTGHNGLTYEDKQRLLQTLLEHATVYISSEDELEPSLMQYKYNLPANELHNFLSCCSLLIGESGSMSSEAAVLGVPVIFNNSAADLFGVFDYICRYNGVFKITRIDEITEKALAVLTSDAIKLDVKKSSEKIISENIDVTNFMVWFVENYPESRDTMKKNPDYQYNFR
ncbi:MAG: DUF354 domain-containing protein [Ignavibacteriales bacterium]|nr:DUF354 domain-containing protein [Ignavibacteriales bacterium]